MNGVSTNSKGEISPLVSIIVNCYNGEKFLKEAIDSIIGQKYLTWEIIFWDNCSSDNSAKIVKSYHDPRIKCYRSKEFTSLVSARRRAVEKCSGEYICFLDCDDIMLPASIKTRVSAMQASNAAIGYGGAIYINEVGNVVPRYFQWVSSTVR